MLCLFLCHTSWKLGHLSFFLDIRHQTVMEVYYHWNRLQLFLASCFSSASWLLAGQCRGVLFFKYMEFVQKHVRSFRSEDFLHLVKLLFSECAWKAEMNLFGARIEWKHCLPQDFITYYCIRFQVWLCFFSLKFYKCEFKKRPAFNIWLKLSFFLSAFFMFCFFVLEKENFYYYFISKIRELSFLFSLTSGSLSAAELVSIFWSFYFLQALVLKMFSSILRNHISSFSFIKSQISS